MPDGEGAEVVAGAAELVGEVVEDASGGGDGAGEVFAAEATERFDVEVVAECVVCLVCEEGVAVVGEAVGEVAEGVGLVVRDDEFLGCEALEGVAEGFFSGEFGDGELAGGVVRVGETVFFS